MEGQEFDAKTDVIVEDSNDKVEALLDSQLDKIEQGTPSDSSPEKQTTEDKAETAKASEDTTSKKSEEAKEETTEAPKGYHDDPAWKRIMDERNTARAERDEFKAKGGLSEEQTQSLEDVKTIIESPAYIKTSMKEQGYTQEAIDAKLIEKGFEAPKPATSDLDAVAKEFGFKSANDLKPEERTYLEEIIKASSAIVDARLKPIESRLGQADQQKQQVEAGRTLVKDLQAKVAEEKILDYTKDVEPMVKEWLDKNPEGLQPDLEKAVTIQINKLNIERLRAGKEQITRDEKKTDLRQNVKGAGSEGKGQKKIAVTDEDAESILESEFDRMGIY